MTISEQITRAFSIGSRSVLLSADWGKVRVSRKFYVNCIGEKRSNFKAELIETGRTMECKADNPFKALAMLHGAVSAQRRGTR